ncbi:hypothetical protein ACTHQY_19280 [Rhodococcoides corynebacterioides]
MHGPYVCSHRDCVCVIDQSTPLSGVNEATFDRDFAPTLHEYA